MAAQAKATRQQRRVPKTATRPHAAVQAAPYLQKLHTAVRDQFAAATDLKTFLATAGALTLAQRQLLVRQALVLIEQNYAHLPLKRALHCIDPVQRLKLLLQALEQVPAAGQPTEAEFHREMTDIFTSVRDLHTNYLLPAPYNEMTAFLPFMVEDYAEAGTSRYIVSHVAPGFSHPRFKPGVEVVYWNGMPIAKAVWNNAQRYAGSNREARHARGVQTLTTRALIIAPPPDEEWVIVGYQTPDGVKEIRFNWMVSPAPPSGAAGDAAVNPASFACLGLDLEQETIQRTRKVLFKPDILVAEQRAMEKVAQGEGFGALESTMPHVFQARPVTTPAGTFGYVRIRTFNVWPPEQFVDEFIRLIAALPPEGLIIDVRGNGGGIIMNGELILQTLTPRTIEPEPTQFMNTPLNLQICRRHDATSPWANLSVWVDSMQQALQTGATFSAGFPITDADACNAIGQKYFGPVVLIVDALCYSTTDIFAAGFQDHEIGPVLGVDGNTGAGGANVWRHQDVVDHVMPGADSVYQPLPHGAGMRVSVRRTLRVGKRAGTPVEDLGILPDERHFMTRQDLLNSNVDLIAKAGALLTARPVRRLHVTVQATSPTQAAIVADTHGMTRLDLYVADRPLQSVDVQGGPTPFAVTKPAATPLTMEIRGFDGTALVARYRTSV